MKSAGVQVESDYGRPKDGLGRVVSEHDLQALAVERAGASKGAYAGVKQPSPTMGNQPGPLALLVKVGTPFLSMSDGLVGLDNRPLSSAPCPFCQDQDPFLDHARERPGA